MGSSGWKASSLTEPAWPGSLYRILLEVVSHTYTNLQQSLGQGRNGPKKIPASPGGSPAGWNNLCVDKHQFPRRKMLLWLAQENREESTGPVVKTSLPRLHFSPQGTEMDLKAGRSKKSLIAQGQGEKSALGMGRTLTSTPNTLHVQASPWAGSEEPRAPPDCNPSQPAALKMAFPPAVPHEPLASIS